MVHFTAADYMQGRHPEFAPERLYLMGILRTTAGIKRFLASALPNECGEPDNAVMHLYNETSRISGVVRAWDR